MPKDYKTIKEVAGPLLLVSGVSGVAFNELGEIILENGKNFGNISMKKKFLADGGIANGIIFDGKIGWKRN